MMGCLLSKKQKTEDPKANNYSWSNREKLNFKDYVIDNQTHETIVKLPGQIKGEQFIIQNCNESEIFLFDFINTISVDDCADCTIFIGPAIGSVVLRNCTNCRIMCASQQFRCRDCRNLIIFLYCATQPTIESCNDIQFGCFLLWYDELFDQFIKANLCPYNNNWRKIYDFTPDDEHESWSFLPSVIDAETHFCKMKTMNELNVSFDSAKSVVPQTREKAIDINEEISLVLFFNDESLHERLCHFLKAIHSKETCTLQQSSQLCVTGLKLQEILGTEAYNEAFSKGLPIALGISGVECVNECQDIIKSMFKTDGLVYVSSSAEQGRAQFVKVFN